MNTTKVYKNKVQVFEGTKRECYDFFKKEVGEAAKSYWKNSKKVLEIDGNEWSFVRTTKERFTEAQENYKKSEKAKKDYNEVTLFSLEDTKKEVTYPSFEEMKKDFVARRDYGYYGLEGWLVKSVFSFYNTPYYKRSEVEELLKTLEVVDNELLPLFNMFRNLVLPPILDLEEDWEKSKYYARKQDLDFVKNLTTRELKPESFPNSEGTWFFKINDDYYDSDTPNYWLFLYRKFGYLNKEKLEDFDDK